MVYLKVFSLPFVGLRVTTTLLRSTSTTGMGIAVGSANSNSLPHEVWAGMDLLKNCFGLSLTYSSQQGSYDISMTKLIHGAQPLWPIMSEELSKNVHRTTTKS